MDKSTLVKIAEDTVKVIEEGTYGDFCIKDEIDYAVRNSKLYSPAMGDLLLGQLKSPEVLNSTKIEVTNESTLQAAKRLIDNGSKVIALNFASGKHPGGGFLRGTVAQEESLAYASALYGCIKPFNEMYDYNLKHKSGLYSDYMIYSPDVPVFKNHLGNYIPPYKVSFITAPAVNKNHLQENEYKIANSIMLKRIEKILAVAIDNQYDTIILGAYGCGVFKNEPNDVAKMFKEILNKEPFKGQFKHIVFAIYDRNPYSPNITAFKNAFRIR